MTTIAEDLAVRLGKAVRSTYPELPDAEIPVKPTENSAFGDFQTEFAMTCARTLKKNPMEIAARLLDALPAEDTFEKKEAVPPGFLNLFLSKSYIENRAAQLAADPLAAARDKLRGERIVVDYSGPNVAKTMHVGHFRATIIGNALCRILKFLGAETISDNHLGDWGTQFGKLIVAYGKWRDPAAYQADPVRELERLYQKFERDADPALQEEARQTLVRLQKGDPECRALWNTFVAASVREFNENYGRLDVSFDHTLGESFYNDRLPAVAEALLKSGTARRDQGALIVDTEARYGIHGPLIVEKSDGGFGYAASDIAAVEYRLAQWQPRRIIYVTDARQQDHFKSVFAIANEWLHPKSVALTHVWFGAIKAKGGINFSTREGNAVPLKNLMDEAVSRARAVVEEKNPGLNEEEKKMVAETVGIAALKYSELSHDLKTDTVFDWERMLSFEGNTAPYHLYTYARAKSVLRKYEEAHGPLPARPKILIENDAVRRLILLADRFAPKITAASRDLKPNHVTEYVHDLAREFNAYYNRRDAVVVKEPDPALRESRAALYRLVSELVKASLSLLGIRVLERM